MVESNLEIKKLGKTFGAEIRGIRLSDISSEEAKDLYDLCLQN